MKYSIYDNYIGRERELLAEDVDVTIVLRGATTASIIGLAKDSPLPVLFHKHRTLTFVSEDGDSITFENPSLIPDLAIEEEVILSINARYVTH